MLLFPDCLAEIIEPCHMPGKMLANGFNDGNHYLCKGQPAIPKASNPWKIAIAVRMTP